MGLLKGFHTNDVQQLKWFMLKFILVSVLFEYLRNWVKCVKSQAKQILSYRLSKIVVT